MKKLFRFSILTMAVISANYFSTYAQGERKAFEEGDKILSVGISGGGSSSGFSRLSPSISFDYGLKGTRGIVSIGGFMSYSNSTTYASYNGFSSSIGINNPDTITRITNSINRPIQHSITAGLRLGLHYSTRKWDLYAGAMIGYNRIIREAYEFQTDVYKGNPSNTNNKPFNTETTTVNASGYSKMVFSPYVGARYYVTPKVSLNLEAGQYTGNVGIGFKF
jgi:hypothetical protein